MHRQSEPRAGNHLPALLLNHSCIVCALFTSTKVHLRKRVWPLQSTGAQSKRRSRDSYSNRAYSRTQACVARSQQIITSSSTGRRTAAHSQDPQDTAKQEQSQQHKAGTWQTCKPNCTTSVVSTNDPGAESMHKMISMHVLHSTSTALRCCNLTSTHGNHCFQIRYQNPDKHVLRIRRRQRA